MATRAYVFDAYGTLFDVHAAIARHKAECGPDAERVSDLWRARQLEYSWTLTLAGRYEDFWTLTVRALDFAMARYPSVPVALKARLLEAYFELDAFADAAPCLTALRKRGHRTAILSNGSPRMLAAAINRARMQPLLDGVFSVDAIRLYKPRREAYAMAAEGFSATAEEIVFVSSNRWDVMGAAAFGFATVWVNRAGMPDEYGDCPAAHAVGDMSSLPDL